MIHLVKYNDAGDIISSLRFTGTPEEEREMSELPNYIAVDFGLDLAQYQVSPTTKTLIEKTPSISSKAVDPTAQ